MTTLAIASRAGATATTAITLEVTQADIDAGVKEDCYECPIAIAFQRTCPGARFIKVEAERIKFDAAGEQHCVFLPTDGRVFVQVFDNGPGIPQPFYFDLPLPTHLVNTPGFLCDDESEYAPVDVTNGCGL